MVGFFRFKKCVGGGLNWVFVNNRYFYYFLLGFKYLITVSLGIVKRESKKKYTMKNVTIINSTRTTDANARKIASDYVKNNFYSVENFVNAGYTEIEVSQPSPNAQRRIFAK